MKVIIISDIKSERKSIIPYGLNLGKHNETKVEIVHMIDPRTHQGVSSPYSDSQSITPGNKLSQDELFNREKNLVGRGLDKLLSAEASRLNYPLKYETRILVDSVDQGLKNIFSEYKEEICVTSLVPDHSMIANLSELMGIFDRVEVPLLIVPPGFKFRELADIIVVTDYSKESHDPVSQALQWFRSFPLTIRAIDITDLNNIAEEEDNRDLWEATVNDFITQSMNLNTKILIGDRERETILEQIIKREADIVMLPKELFRKSQYKLKKESVRTEFFKVLAVPVILF
ncbi:MAG: hypothetical protein WD577_05325 [Bacteroidales bacterium]